MIADANLIAAALLMLPVAMFSRRPIAPQNRGRFTGAGAGGDGVPNTGNGYLIAGSNGYFVTSSNGYLLKS